MKYILILLVSFTCLTVTAQVDTAQVRKNKGLDKKPRLDMLLVDLNWDYLMGVKAPVKQKWFGRGINVSLMFDQPIEKNGRFSVAGGAGFTSHNYYTNALVQKIDSLNVAAFQVQNNTVKEGGKISLNYVDVPVELRFRTMPDKHGHRWKLAVGGRAGYRINVHEKIVNGEGTKTKLYYYPQTALFRYGPTLRFGYGAIMLTGYYSLSTFFQSGKGLNDMNALSVGLTISPF